MFNRSSKEIVDKGEIVDFDDTPFTDDNKVYTEILLPPEGYELEKAVCTTYTLDFNAYLAVLMAFAGDKSQSDDETAQFDAVLKMGDKITVFHDFRQARNVKNDVSLNMVPFKVETPSNESSVRGRNGDGGVPFKAETLSNKRIPAFHPKVWLLKYTNGESAKFKFIVLSRNLSFDTSWDTFIVFNEETNKNTTAAKNKKAILELLKHLKIDSDWEKDLKKIGFSLEGKEDAEIIPLINGKTIDGKDFKFEGKYKKAVIMSPFVNKLFFDKVFNDFISEKTVLITRKTAELNIDNIPNYMGKLDIFTLKQEEQKTDLENQNRDEYIPETGIHAKIYLFEKKGGKSDLYIGSANATSAAFSKNTEVLVMIPNLEYTCENFLEEIRCPDWFDKVENLEGEKKDSLEQFLDKILDKIFDMEWTGELERQETGFLLKINVPNGLKDGFKDDNGNLVPVTVKINNQIVKEKDIETPYNNSNYVVLEVSVSDGNQEKHKQRELPIRITYENGVLDEIEKSAINKYGKKFLKYHFTLNHKNSSSNHTKSGKTNNTQPESSRLKAYSARQKEETPLSYENLLLCALKDPGLFDNNWPDEQQYKLIKRIQECLKGENK